MCGESSLFGQLTNCVDVVIPSNAAVVQVSHVILEGSVIDHRSGCVVYGILWYSAVFLGLLVGICEDGSD